MEQVTDVLESVKRLLSAFKNNRLTDDILKSHYELADIAEKALRATSPKTMLEVTKIQKQLDNIIDLNIRTCLQKEIMEYFSEDHLKRLILAMVDMKAATSVHKSKAKTTIDDLETALDNLLPSFEIVLDWAGRVVDYYTVTRMLRTFSTGNKLMMMMILIICTGPPIRNVVYYFGDRHRSRVTELLIKCANFTDVQHVSSEENGTDFQCMFLSLGNNIQQVSVSMVLHNHCFHNVINCFSVTLSRHLISSVMRRRVSQIQNIRRVKVFSNVV